MPAVHVVEPFEHISGIAHRYGFRDFHTIWDHPANAALKRRRENPHVLLAGDQLTIPDREDRIETRPTDQHHRFVARGQSLKLNVRLLDESGLPVRDLPAVLTVESVHTDEKTDGDGRLSLTIPPGSAHGHLLVNTGGTVKVREGSAAGAGAPSSAGAGSASRSTGPSRAAPETGTGAAGPRTPGSTGASAFPRPGCDNDGTSPGPSRETPEPARALDRGVPPVEKPTAPDAPERPPVTGFTPVTATWFEVDLPLGVGELDPVDTVSGWTARLHNLGYEPGPFREPATPGERRRQRSAVEEFQCDQRLVVDGVMGPGTQAKLKQAHGA